MKDIMEREVGLWEADQRFCEIANTILQTLVEKQTNVRDSLWILEKAKRTIENSVQSTSWGALLTIGSASNEAPVLDRKAVIAEINRRKGRDDSCNP